MIPAINPHPIALVQSAPAPDHFLGVEAALGARGLVAGRYDLDQAPPRLDHQTRVVVVADVLGHLNLRALREARRVGARTVLLMDGMMEWRNTFCNPRVAFDFLHPAPVDVVAVAGEIDRRVLEALGNRAVVTGLPRLRGIIDTFQNQPVARASGERAHVLVATANNPAFDPRERDRLTHALNVLKEVAGHQNEVDIRWRLDAQTARDLGVVRDTDSLINSLRWAHATITSPSTLMIESMLAGRPTGVLHVHPTPTWQAAPWGWHPTLTQRELIPDSIESLIVTLLNPDPEKLEQQSRWRESLHPADNGAADRLADLLVDLVQHESVECPLPTVIIPSPVRWPKPLAKVPGRHRVVNCIYCDKSTPERLIARGQRLSEAFTSNPDLGYDIHTLFIGSSDNSIARLAGPDEPGLAHHPARSHRCIIDPADDHLRTILNIRKAIARLNPDIILPNFMDGVYAASMQLRALNGARVIFVAHADDDDHRMLAHTYREWDGAIDMGGSSEEWLRDVVPLRPVAAVPFGVPITSQPRRVAKSGPLEIASFGSVTQWGGRVFDLLGLIDGLESRHVAFRFHLIGDGLDLSAWHTELLRRDLRCGTVTIHGKRSLQWVQQFLPRIDFSVLMGEFNGDDLSLLEGMGHGVVPVMTRDSGRLCEWICDGENGVLTPIGEPEVMSERFAQLAQNRSLISSLGRAAWQTAQKSFSLTAMAEQYQALFNEMLSKDPVRGLGMSGLRLVEARRWVKMWADDPAHLEQQLKSCLADLGFHRVVIGEPRDDCDAVIVNEDSEPIPPKEIREWEQQGVLVVRSPHLLIRRWRSLVEIIQDTQAGGPRRIVLYGIGRHTQRALRLMPPDISITGFIDDYPPPDGVFMSKPVCRLIDAIPQLRPDVVILSSDVYEKEMWHRTRPLREAGLCVIPLYTNFSETDTILPDGRERSGVK